MDMNDVHTARVIGTISLMITVVLKGFILARQRLWLRYGRAAGIWLILYIYFLIVIRIFSIFELASRDQLTIISGYAAIIPLFGILLHILIRGREDKI